MLARFHLYRSLHYSRLASAVFALHALSRFGAAILLAVAVAVLIDAMAGGGCHPASCHLWDSSDIWWWYYGCWTDHCEECGYGSNAAAAVWHWIVG